MLTASAVRSMAQQEITDAQYIMANVQCKIIQAALEEDSKCWIRFHIRSLKDRSNLTLKDRSNLKGVANDVVKILTENGFEAESEIFADAEYEEYLRFRISWEG